MTKNSKREESVRFSVNFPKSLLEEINTICAHNFMTKNAWIVQAAKNVLEKSRLEKLKKLKSEITDEVE